MMRSPHPVALGVLLVCLAGVVWEVDNLLVSAMTCLLLLVVSAAVGGPRRMITHVGAVVGVLLALWWLAVAVLVPRQGSSGRVLLTLPARRIGPSVNLGGTVHDLDLLVAAAQVLHCLAPLLCGLLLCQVIPAQRCLDALALVLGRGAGVLAPVVCLPQALSASLLDRARLARRGVAPSITETMTDAFRTAVETGRGWTAGRVENPPRLWPRVIVIVLAAGAVPFLIARMVRGEAVGVSPWILPGLCAAIAVLVLIRLERPGRAWLGRMGASDWLLLVLAAVEVVGGWLAGRSGGVGGTEATSLTSVPVIVVLTTAVVLVGLVVELVPGRRDSREAGGARP